MIDSISGRFDKRWLEALNEFNKMMDLDQKDAEAYYSRAVAFDKLGKHKPAIADINKAIKFNPKHAMSYYVRGVIFGKMCNYDEAIADLDKALDLDQKDAENNHNCKAKFHKSANLNFKNES